MKKLWPLLAVLVVGYLLAGRGELPDAGPEEFTGTAPATERVAGAGKLAGDEAIARAFAEQRSSVQVQGEGTVERLLVDDRDGSRHQRIIVRLRHGQTVLLAHNIDLAPRVDSLQAGDRIAFRGEYEWNPQGGVIHWTHRDPAGQHVGGWLEVAGRRYE